MSFLTIVLLIVTLVLYSRLNTLKTRVDTAETQWRTLKEELQRQLLTMRREINSDRLANIHGADTHSADPHGALLPAGESLPQVPALLTSAPGVSFPGGPVRFVHGPAASAVKAAPLALHAAQIPAAPRSPVDVQRWLTRAGIAATLIGLAFLLSVMETLGTIGPQWRLLAGLALGGWLTWRAKVTADTGLSSFGRASRWEAETLGTLGMAVSLLTLTAAARSGGGSVTWTVLLTAFAFASVYLARGWGGTTTPLASLTALAIALPLAQSAPGAHLWNLDLPGLLCLTWTLACLALLPLLPARNEDESVAPETFWPGGIALALLGIFTQIAESGALSDNRPERLALTLTVAVLTLAGMVLCGQKDEEKTSRTLRSLVAGVALASASWAVTALTGLQGSWAVPIAALSATALFAVGRRSAIWERLDLKILARLTFTSAVTAALTSAMYGVTLHQNFSWKPDLLAAGAGLLAVILAALALNRDDTGTTDALEERMNVRVPRLLQVLALCAPLGLAFGLAGVTLPGVVWLARRTVPGETPDVSPLGGLSAESVRSWRAWPLLLWASLTLPALAGSGFGNLLGMDAYGVQDLFSGNRLSVNDSDLQRLFFGNEYRVNPTWGHDLAAFGETALLFLGAAALCAFAALKIISPRREVQPWPTSLLLAWSGTWLLAATFGNGQTLHAPAFVLTTPWLALLGGWLLSRAQPAQPGVPAWKWSVWMSGAGLLGFALLRVLLFDLGGTNPLFRAAGLLGAGLVTVLAGVRLPPPPRP